MSSGRLLRPVKNAITFLLLGLSCSASADTVFSQDFEDFKPLAAQLSLQDDPIPPGFVRTTILSDATSGQLSIAVPKDFAYGDFLVTSSGDVRGFGSNVEGLEDGTDRHCLGFLLTNPLLPKLGLQEAKTWFFEWKLAHPTQHAQLRTAIELVRGKGLGAADGSSMAAAWQTSLVVALERFNPPPKAKIEAGGPLERVALDFDADGARLRNDSAADIAIKRQVLVESSFVDVEAVASANSPLDVLSSDDPVLLTGGLPDTIPDWYVSLITPESLTSLRVTEADVVTNAIAFRTTAGQLSSTVDTAQATLALSSNVVKAVSKPLLLAMSRFLPQAPNDSCVISVRSAVAGEATAGAVAFVASGGQRATLTSAALSTLSAGLTTALQCGGGALYGAALSQLLEKMIPGLGQWSSFYDIAESGVSIGASAARLASAIRAPGTETTIVQKDSLRQARLIVDIYEFNDAAASDAQGAAFVALRPGWARRLHDKIVICHDGPLMPSRPTERQCHLTSMGETQAGQWNIRPDVFSVRDPVCFDLYGPLTESEAATVVDPDFASAQDALYQSWRLYIDGPLPSDFTSNRVNLCVKRPWKMRGVYGDVRGPSPDYFGASIQSIIAPNPGADASILFSTESPEMGFRRFSVRTSSGVFPVLDYTAPGVNNRLCGSADTRPIRELIGTPVTTSSAIEKTLSFSGSAFRYIGPGEDQIGPCAAGEISPAMNFSVWVLGKITDVLTTNTPTRLEIATDKYGGRHRESASNQGGYYNIW